MKEGDLVKFKFENLNYYIFSLSPRVHTVLSLRDIIYDSANTLGLYLAHVADNESKNYPHVFGGGRIRIPVDYHKILLMGNLYLMHEYSFEKYG